MQTTSPPLRIAILGVGKIGSAFAFQLAREGGHEVTAIARPGSPRLAQLQADRAIVDVKGARAQVRVADRLDPHEPYDLVIVTLLAHQVAPFAQDLQESAADCIQFMFNTFQPERLQADLGSERCAFGMPFLQATLNEAGRLHAVIGAGGQKSLMSRQRWVDVFNAAGLPAALEPNMPLWLRCHTPFCVAFESISVAGERRGGGASWADAKRVALGVRASFALIRALGFEVYPPAKKTIADSPPWVTAAILWVMSRIGLFRRLLAAGEVECRALVDVMVSCAPLGSPTAQAIAAMKPL